MARRHFRPSLPQPFRIPALISTCACLGVLVLGPANQTAAQTTPRAKPLVEIKVATLAPENTSLLNTFHEADVEVREKTGGKVGLKIYPGGTMGEEPTVVTKCKLGELHGGIFTGIGLGELLPAVRVLEIPFLYRNYEEWDAARVTVAEMLSRLFTESGWIELGHTEVGFVYVFSVKRIASMDDLKKSKLVLITGDPLAQLTMAVAGLKPIPQSPIDVLTSLSTGIVDTVYLSPVYALALQWNTKTHFMIDYPFTAGTGSFIVQKKQFDKIPEDLRPVVLEITRRRFENLIPQTRKEQAEAIDQMRRQGMSVTEVSEEERKRFESESAKTREKLPEALYPSDRAKQELVRGLIATAVKAVEQTRAVRTAAAAAP